MRRLDAAFFAAVKPPHCKRVYWKLCCHIAHYVSKRDIVPYFDIFGRMRCANSIVHLDPHKEAYEIVKQQGKLAA